MPCTNVVTKKELTSTKQIAGQKSKTFTYSSPQFYVISPADSTRNAPSWNVAEKSLCQFPRALTDCLARSPKIIRTYNVSSRMGFSNPWLPKTWRCTFACIRQNKENRRYFVWTCALWAMKFSAPTAFLSSVARNIYEQSVVADNVNKCNLIAWENSRHFARSPLEPSQNDVWVTSAEIPYWWRTLPRSW